MPTSITDQFFRLDPFDPPPFGTALAVETLVLVDQNDDSDIEVADGDTVDGLSIIQQFPGDTVTIDVPGVGNVTYTGITFYLSSGEQVFTPTDGQILQDGTFVTSSFVTTEGVLDTGDLPPVCFAAGTEIATPDGPRPVEDLAVGELVTTLDNGPQQVRWIGKRRLDPRDLARNPRLRPVRIPAGALSEGSPERDLLVSRQHRLLVRSRIARRMFGRDEVLVPAIKLVGTAGIAEADAEAVTYVHVLFDRHEIVFGNGAPSESLFTGPMALAAIGAEAREEIFELFPELARAEERPPARPLVDGRRGRRLSARHALNGQPFLCAATQGGR